MAEAGPSTSVGKPGNDAAPTTWVGTAMPNAATADLPQLAAAASNLHEDFKTTAKIVAEVKSAIEDQHRAKSEAGFTMVADKLDLARSELAREHGVSAGLEFIAAVSTRAQTAAHVKQATEDLNLIELTAASDADGITFFIEDVADAERYVRAAQGTEDRLPDLVSGLAAAQACSVPLIDQVRWIQAAAAALKLTPQRPRATT